MFALTEAEQLAPSALSFDVTALAAERYAALAGHQVFDAAVVCVMAHIRAAGGGAFRPHLPTMVPLIRQPLRMSKSWHFAFAGCIYEQHQQARHAATTAVILRRNRITPV